MKFYRTPRRGSTPWTADVSMTLCGWWVRFAWGVTFRPERLRFHRFYGYGLVAVRLWGSPLAGRLALVQWRRA